MTKRFLRFGRRGPSDSFFESGPQYYTNGRRFVRLGRAYEPYQDKRFLRFGRSQQQNQEDSILREAYLQADEPLLRKRRSVTDQDSLREGSSRMRRSAEDGVVDRTQGSRMIQKRDAEGNVADDSFNHAFLGLGLGDKDVIRQPGKTDRESGDDAGEVNKRFMRFGRLAGNGDEDVQKRFMRFGKRFMRFGRQASKRFLRFGRDWQPAKRFMRFGRSENGADITGLGSEPKIEGEKRFMRFGKRDTKAAESRTNAVSQ